MENIATAPATPTGPAEGVAGGWQAPSSELAQQIAGLSPESRAAQADFLRDRYPNDRAAIDQAYGITPAVPTTQAEQLDAMFKKGDATGADMNLTDGISFLNRNGYDAGEAVEFVTDLQTNLAALEMPASIAASLGEEMIRAAHTSQHDPDPEAVNARWDSQTRPLIERIARNVDGTPATWEQVKAGFQAAFNKFPEEFRGEVVRSGALNSASVVLQLFLAGSRMLARQGMSK